MDDDYDDDDVVIITENLSWTVIEESQAKDFEDVLMLSSTEPYEKQEEPEDFGDERSTRLINRPNGRERGSYILVKLIYLRAIYDTSVCALSRFIR